MRLMRSRRCWRWRRLVWREVDGSLSPREGERLRTHLPECPECRSLMDEAMRLDRLLAAEPREQPARGFEDRVLLGIAAGAAGGAGAASRPRPEKVRRSSEEAGDWWILGGGLAAAALVAISAAAIVPRLAVRAVHAAVQPHAAFTGGALDLLFRSLKAFALSGQSITTILQSPLFVPLALMAGVLAITLGWVRLILSRSTG